MSDNRYSSDGKQFGREFDEVADRYILTPTYNFGEALVTLCFETGRVIVVCAWKLFKWGRQVLQR